MIVSHPVVDILVTVSPPVHCCVFATGTHWHCRCHSQGKYVMLAIEVFLISRLTCNMCANKFTCISPCFQFDPFVYLSLYSLLLFSACLRFARLPDRCLEEHGCWTSTFVLSSFKTTLSSKLVYSPGAKVMTNICVSQLPCGNEFAILLLRRGGPFSHHGLQFVLRLLVESNSA